MKAVVSVLGRFHAFHLARQLQRRGHLKRLITSYPIFEVKKYGLQTADVSGLVPYEIAKLINTRVPQLEHVPPPPFVMQNSHRTDDRCISRSQHLGYGIARSGN